MCNGKPTTELVCNCSGVKKMDIQTRSTCRSAQSGRHSISPSSTINSGLLETKNQESYHLLMHSTKRRIPQTRVKPPLENNSTSYSVLSSTHKETSTTSLYYSQGKCSPQKEPIKYSNRRNLEKVIPSPIILDEHLHTEAEYAVRQDTTNEIVTVERVEYDEHDYRYLESDSSNSGSVVSLNSILIEEKDFDTGPKAVVVCDDDFNLNEPFCDKQIIYRKRPAIYPRYRSHSLSDINRRIHVLDELLFSIDFEYGASDIGPQPEVLFDDLPGGKVHGADGRQLIHRSSDSEVIIDSMFTGKKPHSCCKARRKLSWNSGIRQRKKAAQLNIVPHRRPRKVVVIGDMCSGKSALISAYCKDRFNEMYVPTILRSCITDADLCGEKIQLVVIEISGREDYQKLRNCSYRKTDAIILCYSCDNPSSVEKIKTYWLPEVKERIPNVPLILVETKKDIREKALDHLDEMSYEDREQNLKAVNEKFVLQHVGHDLSESIGAHSFLECSAKYRDGTRNVFETVAKVALQKSRRKKKVQKTGDCGIM